ILRFGSAVVAAGKCRIVVRVAKRSDADALALMILDAEGSPLATRAPAIGDAAPATASSGRAYDVATIAQSTAAETDLVAAALLATGEHRRARALLEASRQRSAAGQLLYARALVGSDDVSVVHRRELARAAYDSARATWPDSWEAEIGHVELEA